MVDEETRPVQMAQSEESERRTKRRPRTNEVAEASRSDELSDEDRERLERASDPDFVRAHEVSRFGQANAVAQGASGAPTPEFAYLINAKRLEEVAAYHEKRPMGGVSLQQANMQPEVVARNQSADEHERAEVERVRAHRDEHPQVVEDPREIVRIEHTIYVPRFADEDVHSRFYPAGTKIGPPLHSIGPDGEFLGGDETLYQTARRAAGLTPLFWHPDKGTYTLPEEAPRREADSPVELDIPLDPRTVEEVRRRLQEPFPAAFPVVSSSPDGVVARPGGRVVR